MQRLTFTKCVFQFKNGRSLLRDRSDPAQNYLISKRNFFSKKNKAKKDDDDDDEKLDQPIKFSTSKAATFPAAYTVAEARGEPWYQGIVITACLLSFMVYFGILREENDIDAKMVQNIPPEILEQIYGKPKDKK